MRYFRTYLWLCTIFKTTNIVINHLNTIQAITKVDLVKFVMCTQVSRVHMMFYILTKGHTVPENRGTHDKLNQIEI